ncbi:zinc finger protein ZPR1-like protein [Cucumis melo var. makuwa]|uniref:Zinc finger protein ZPR1-like protein n=1 Tax=Cucumis melo var. makuwa TaxID=1194695 RepID=A0A5A7U5M7_CUCMM|nr:zinc finger protein ZPR1-like protein [Cucumis melo var. makuwa]
MTPRETSVKGFNECREFSFSRRVLRDFSMSHHCVGKSPLNSFQFCKLQNRNREEKKKGEEVVAIVLFCRCSAVVRRRPPSLLSLAAVCHFSYGCVGYPAVMVASVVWRVVRHVTDDFIDDVGSQPLSEDEICDQVLGRRPDYSKGLGWGPKPKARRTASASIQDRNHQALASQVEAMKKMIEDLTRAQQGPPHDP